ncbi:poly(U)-specific 3'-to-5' RNA exonuclease [Lunasporangiospora selenospora]|uniref:U6 snRNA phosphodiesterase 1 n=1 Tax=Lunasporangiospora selenospora TaxID=979761 RepID=A0A9P6KFZ4_9FUNG|nr:poly(U)-specific 3'-to-5' RNA exonuclease [Lunasporangiospora selenospora]
MPLVDYGSSSDEDNEDVSKVHAKPIKLSSELFDIVTALTKRAQETVPETTSMLHSLKSSKGEVKVAEHADDAVELHVSLSRPLYLQELHLGRFTSDVKEAFKNKRRFNMSFSGIQRFANEENTRSFLSLRVGSGHAEVENLLTEMDSIAERYSQPKFYDHPQFHASFAWALGGDTLDESLVNILDDLDSTLLQDLRRCSVMVRRVSWKTGPTLGSVEFSQ